MQNEEISNKTISISTRSAEKVLRFLAKNGFKGLKALAKTGNRKIFHEGKQSYKSLSKSGQGLTPVDIDGSDEIKLFKKCAKKYRLDFAVKKDKTTGLYRLFFKAKDADIYDIVFKNYKQLLNEKSNKKSLSQQLDEKKKEVEKEKQVEGLTKKLVGKIKINNEKEL